MRAWILYALLGLVVHTSAVVATSYTPLSYPGDGCPNYSLDQSVSATLDTDADGLSKLLSDPSVDPEDLAFQLYGQGYWYLEQITPTDVKVFFTYGGYTILRVRGGSFTAHSRVMPCILNPMVSLQAHSSLIPLPEGCACNGADLCICTPNWSPCHGYWRQRNSFSGPGPHRQLYIPHSTSLKCSVIQFSTNNVRSTPICLYIICLVALTMVGGFEGSIIVLKFLPESWYGKRVVLNIGFSLGTEHTDEVIMMAPSLKQGSSFVSLIK